MKVINLQGKIINVTEKAYNYIYKDKGFKKINDLNLVNQGEKDKPNIIGIEDTKEPTSYEILAKKNITGLKAILDEYNIEYNSRAKKDELISLILENMEG